MKREYAFSWVIRIILFLIGLTSIIIGFAADGVKFLGTTTKQGAFTPLIVGCYETCPDRSIRYRWKIKYEFWIEGEKYVGSKYLRGGDSSITYKKEIGYIKAFPRINWLETDEHKGINLFIGIILGQAFIWLAFKKRPIFTHDLNRTYNGIFYANTGILPVKGMNTTEVIEFIKNLFRVGIKKIFTVKVIIFIVVMLTLWSAALWARVNYPNNGLCVVLSWLTYARGGIHGNIINVFGGILGKILYLTFFLQLILEGKFDTNYYNACPAMNITIYGRLSNFASLVLGFGVSLILFELMTAGLSYEDSFIGVIAMFACFKAYRNINNPIMMLINSFKNGRPRNARAARTAMFGAAWGFLLSFGLIWTEYNIYLGSYYGLIVCMIGWAVLFLSSLIKKSQNEIEVEI